MFKKISNYGWREYLSGAIVLFAVLVFIGNTYQLHLERWDDAYITFRFADRVAAGQGLIWNLGGAPVEGYTSPLHMLILAAGIRLGLNPELASLLIGLVGAAVTFAMMLLIVRSFLGGLRPAAVLVLSIFLLDKTTAFHVTSGLETQLFVVMLCAAYLAALWFVESPRWFGSILLALTTFMAILTRPEGAIYAVGIYGALIYYSLQRERATDGKGRLLLRLLLPSFAATLVGTAYLLWKLNYFGYLLPNPYYVKSDQVSLAGINNVLFWLAHLALWFSPVLVATLLFWLKKRSAIAISWSLQTQAKVLLTLGPPLLALLYYVTIVHEVGGAHRFSYPTYFYLIIAAAVIFAFTANALATLKPFRLAAPALAIIWLVVPPVVQGSWRTSPRPLSDFHQYHLKIAKALQATGLGSKGTVLCDAAGVIPYVSGFNQVDRVGLTDNTLSGRKKLTPEERDQYIWTTHPDVYVGYEPPALTDSARPEQEPRMTTAYVSRVLLNRKPSPIEDRIFARTAPLLHQRMLELRKNWVLVGEVNWPGWRIWKLKSFIYVRKESPHAEALVESLQSIVSIAPAQIDLDNLDQDPIETVASR
jgi:hypothetical protein